MNPSPTNQIIKYVGLDVHAQTIAVAIAHAGGDAFEELLNAVQDPARRIERLTQAIEGQLATWSRRPLVEALMCLRGLALLWRRTDARGQ